MEFLRQRTRDLLVEHMTNPTLVLIARPFNIMHMGCGSARIRFFSSKMGFGKKNSNGTDTRSDFRRLSFQEMDRPWPPLRGR